MRLILETWWYTFFQPLPKPFRYINSTCTWLLPNRNGYSLMECLLPFWYSIETPLSCATAIYICIRWAWSISHICDIYIIFISIFFIMVNGRAEQCWNGRFRFTISPLRFHLPCDDDVVFMHRYKRLNQMVYGHFLLSLSGMFSFPYSKSTCHYGMNLTFALMFVFTDASNEHTKELFPDLKWDFPQVLISK